MGFAIPKIQYKNVNTIGSVTTGDGTLVSLASVVGIEVGMFARGSGIPAGALVESIVGSNVNLAGGVVGTSDEPDTDLSFGYEILFDYPPKEPTGELVETKGTVSESLSGIRQVSINYVEGTRKLNFSFLSPSLYALLNNFLTTFALLGNTFRYYEDKTLTDFVEYELDTLKHQPKKIAPRGVDTYVWEVPLVFRRVL